MWVSTCPALPCPDLSLPVVQAIGEPPFFLGACVFFALKEAVYAARADAGKAGYFRLDLPATPERLRMLCADDIAAKYVPGGNEFVAKISC